MNVAIRVYGSLNDFLPTHRRQATWSHVVDGHPSVKDVIESVGVPHPEIDLILVNGASVSFDYAAQNADRIAAFPVFQTLDIKTLTRVRARPLERIRFIADVHLGKLAKHLRLCGIDTAYRADAEDGELADLAVRDERILLTRDVGLLKRRIVVQGYFIRETHPRRQLVEVIRRFAPLVLDPFSRCLECNGVLTEVPKSAVDAELQPRTRQHYERFTKCNGCGRIYWKGSHLKRLTQAIDAARIESERHFSINFLNAVR